jgi:hypothetical protein
MPNPQAGGTSLVGCPRLFLQYIRSWRLYNAVVTRDSPSIKMDLREMGWDGMDWIDLTQDRDQSRALVNTVINLRVT